MLVRPLPLALQSLINQLAALPGVRRVVLDERRTVVVVICDRPGSPTDISALARERMDALGLEHLDVEVTFRGVQREGARIRFLGVTREDRPDRALQVTVTLEWQGREITASVRSERGEPPELRAVALATVEAVTRLVGQDLHLRVGGIKRVRAFDVDLMVAALNRAAPTPQQLVGAVVAGDDPYRAAARAVLNALNRPLGNYLAR